MYSLWDLSTDSVVTTLIVICISALAIAWLFAGRRRPVKHSELEQRRLAGREAEVFATPEAPFVEAQDQEATSEEMTSAELAGEPFVAPQDEAHLSAPPEVFENQRTAEADNKSPSLETLQLSQLAKEPPNKPAKAPQTPRSAEQASAMSIAAALVRHDKREVKPAAPPKRELPLESVGSGGDDLTTITGIDPIMAKELNDLGIRYFDQFVELSPEHAAWIASRLSTPVTSAQRAAWVAEAHDLIEQPAPVGRSHAGRAG